MGSENWVNANKEKSHSHSTFERRWRERFEGFAEGHDDDASIAGWSRSSLEARLRFFRRSWQCEEKGAIWLDAGCGAGTYSRYLASHGMTVIGLDYSIPSIRKARSRDHHNIYWVVGDIKRLPIDLNTTQGLLCFGVTQALSDSRNVVQETTSVLAIRGQYWIDGLNAWCIFHMWEVIKRKIQKKPQHMRYERPARLIKILKECGMQPIRLYWLPILPQRLRYLQRVMESRFMIRVLHVIPFIGALISHSFVIYAERVD